MVLKHTAYFILDEPEVASLSKLVKKMLHIDLLTKAEQLMPVCYCMSIYLSLFSHFKTEYDTELQETTV